MAQGSAMTFDRSAPFSEGMANGTAGAEQYMGNTGGEQAVQQAVITQRARREIASAGSHGGPATAATATVTAPPSARGRTPRRRRPVPTQGDTGAEAGAEVASGNMGAEQAIHASKTPSRKRSTSGGRSAVAKAGTARSGRGRSKSRARAAQE
jgi:hypothetical protein